MPRRYYDLGYGFADLRAELEDRARQDRRVRESVDEARARARLYPHHQPHQPPQRKGAK